MQIRDVVVRLIPVPITAKDDLDPKIKALLQLHHDAVAYANAWISNEFQPIDPLISDIKAIRAALLTHLLPADEAPSLEPGSSEAPQTPAG